MSREYMVKIEDNKITAILHSSYTPLNKEDADYFKKVSIVNFTDIDLAIPGVSELIEYNKDNNEFLIINLQDRNFIESENKKSILRDKRQRLLEAFDLWEKAVLRGREEDSEEIMQWYQDILDLNENSILDNIPEKITYYL